MSNCRLFLNLGALLKNCTAAFGSKYCRLLIVETVNYYVFKIGNCIPTTTKICNVGPVDFGS